MNDDFLNRFQKSPRPDFESALYQKINKPLRSPVPGRIQFTLAAVTALFALTVIFVPQARAAIQSVIRKIAGITFDERTSPTVTCDPMDCAPQEVAGRMSFEEAQKILPFAVHLPEWTPQGYWLNPRTTLVHINNGDDLLLEVEWLKSGLAGEDQEDYVQQMVLHVWQDRGQGETWTVAPESISEVSVNGEPAALVHGGWMLFSNDWNSPGMTNLAWKKNGVWYQLSAVFHDPSTAIPDEEMIRIAESIP
ncbi:MAG: DUF4367 domain-containing protein [Chloroflexi bacterium]|nr:DUF4367 domain-containing protein [Chloroflexota bacterium]